MNPNRRRILQLVGAGTLWTLTGCLGDGNGEPSSALVGTDTMPFSVRTGRPRWYEADDDATGHVVVIDSEKRMQAVLGYYDLTEERRRAVSEFIEELDFDEERLLVVESVGPNLCYDRLDVSNVRLEDGRIHGEAETVDTSEENEACAQAVAYPSTLVRVTFENSPVDGAAIEITDGWGVSGTVTASTDDSLSPDPEDLPGYVAPETDSEPIEPLECPDEAFERHWQGFDEPDVRRGDLEVDSETKLAMRVADTEYERGDTVSIRLVNVSDETVDTGNRNKYNLQVYTEDSWQEVRGSEDGPLPYTDEAIVHYPGDGFEWSFALSEDDIAEAAIHDLRVCPDLQSGRYRFVFWGVIGDGAVAVEFDVTE